MCRRRGFCLRSIVLGRRRLPRGPRGVGAAGLDDVRLQARQTRVLTLGEHTSADDRRGGRRSFLAARWLVVARGPTFSLPLLLLLLFLLFLLCSRHCDEFDVIFHVNRPLLTWSCSFHRRRWQRGRWRCRLRCRRLPFLPLGRPRRQRVSGQMHGAFDWTPVLWRLARAPVITIQLLRDRVRCRRASVALCRHSRARRARRRLHDGS